MITKKTKKTKNIENYEILRKKGNTLIKNHVIVIFYAKSVYFFIHLKNVFMAFFLFFVHFPFFSLFSFLFVICESILFSEKIVIVRKRFFSIGLFVAGFCCIFPPAN